MKKAAFTLIELIVVIAILSILGTISFISFKGFNLDARNAVRISDLTNITQAIGLSYEKKGNYVNPSNSKTLTIDGLSVGKYGKVGDSVLNSISISGNGKDPLNNQEYYYSTIKNSFNVLGFFEENFTFNQTATAEDLSKQIYKIYGDSEIYITKSDLTPIESNISDIDLSLDITLLSKNEKQNINNTSDLKNRVKESCLGLKQFMGKDKSGKYNIKPNGINQEVYCDMKIDEGGWALIFHGYPSEISTNNSVQITNIGPGLTGKELMIKYVNHNYSVKDNLTGRVNLTKNFSYYYYHLMNFSDKTSPKIQFDGGITTVGKKMLYGYGNIWRVFASPTFTLRGNKSIYIGFSAKLKDGTIHIPHIGKENAGIVQPCDWPTIKNSGAGKHECWYNYGVNTMDDKIKESVSGLTMKKFQEVKVYIR